MSDAFLRSEIKDFLSSVDIFASFHHRILQSSKENLLVKYHLLTNVLVNIKKLSAKSISKKGKGLGDVEKIPFLQYFFHKESYFLNFTAVP